MITGVSFFMPKAVSIHGAQRTISRYFPVSIKMKKEKIMCFFCRYCRFSLDFRNVRSWP